MEPAGIPWSVVGPIATLVGALLGIGVGWGAMKSIVASLKLEVINIKVIATEMKEEVVTLKADGVHIARSIGDLSNRVNELEKDVSALKAKQPNRKR